MTGDAVIEVHEVTLVCFHCREPFTIPYGPGRPRRFCDSDCAVAEHLAKRRNRRRAAYLERQEAAWRSYIALKDSGKIP